MRLEGFKLELEGDMEIDAENPVPHSYTILRIKRKRNEEPLDALGRPSVKLISFSDHRQMVLIHASCRVSFS